MARVLSISNVQLMLQKSNPPSLLVLAAGKVGTPGWRNLDLRSIEKKLSDDGILDVEMIGTPPQGPIIQLVTDVTADLVITSDVERIVGVAVHSRTNIVTQLLGESTLAPEDAAAGRLTTLAVGEEDRVPKFPGGEKLPFGEKWPVGEKFPIGEKWPIGEKLPYETQALIPGESSPFALEKDFRSEIDIRTTGMSFPGEDRVIDIDQIRTSPFTRFRRG